MINSDMTNENRYSAKARFEKCTYTEHLKF